MNIIRIDIFKAALTLAGILAIAGTLSVRSAMSKSPIHGVKMKPESVIY